MGLPDRKDVGTGPKIPREYDAFISYSRIPDEALANAIKVELQRFATPWYRTRSVAICLDRTNLGADPALWSLIEQELGRSRWLLLLASPEAAASYWVDREVEWWLTHRDPARILIALTGGEIAWDRQANRPDTRRATALPRALVERTWDEPLWVDLRWLGHEPADRDDIPWQDALASLYSPLRGISKDEVVGEHVRQRRRTMRWVQGAVATLSVLLVIALIASAVAILQRDRAQAEARVATSRQLAALATAMLDDDLETAQQLAVEGYLMDDNPQTRAALSGVVTSSPRLSRYLFAGEQVSALVASGDGSTVVAGTAGGHIVAWQLRQNSRWEATSGGEPITELAASHDGAVVVATDGSTVYRWSPDEPEGPHQLDLGEISGVADVAISPSGAVLAVSGPALGVGSEEPADSELLAIFDGASGRRLRIAAIPAGYEVFLNDDDILTLASVGGRLEHRRVADPREVTSFRPGVGQFICGANRLWVGLAERGRYHACVHFGLLQIRRLAGEPAQAEWRQAAQDIPVPVRLPDRLALSPQGDRVALVQGGTIHVQSAVQPSPPDEPIADSYPGDTLTGNDTIAFLAFLGDKHHLVSAGGDAVALWDLGQQTRIGHGVGPPIQRPCSACPAATVVASPDGERVAVVDNYGTVAVYPADLASDPHLIYDVGPTAAINSLTYAPAWLDDGQTLVLVGGEWGQARGEAWDVQGRPWLVSTWQTGGASRPPVTVPPIAAHAARGGTHLVTVYEDGSIVLERFRDHHVERRFSAHVGDDGQPPSISAAAVSQDGRFVGYIATTDIFDPPTTSEVVVMDIESGRRRTMPTRAGGTFAFSGDRVLVVREDAVYAWDLDREDSEPVALPLPPYRVYAATRSGLVAQLSPDSRITVTDIESGETAIEVPGLLPDDVDERQHSAMTFAASGGRLYAAVPGTPLTGWTLLTQEWVAVACGTSDRGLDSQSWSRMTGNEPPTRPRCGGH
jgi:WD40 repeat protein